MPHTPKPYVKENMFTTEQLPPLLSMEEQLRLRTEAQRANDQSSRIPLDLLEQQATAQHRIKTESQSTFNAPKTEILDLSQTLKTLFTVKDVKLFQADNYLEHAKKIVRTFNQLHTAINHYNWAEHAVKNELDEELNNIYEILADHGWGCDATAPQGLMPASEKGLIRFIAGLKGKAVELSEYSNPLAAAKTLHLICRNAFKATNSSSVSPAAASTPAATKASTAARASAAASASVELDDLSKLIKKIKNSAPLFHDPLIIGNPFVANQTNKKEKKADDFGFTPLFYAAKYQKSKGSIPCILHHCTNAKMLSNALNSTLQDPQNPYFGARALMISARFGTSATLNELLDKINSAERVTYVNYAISKKGQYTGWTALHFACQADYSSPEELAVLLKKVTILLNEKANINAQSKATPAETPLSIALSTKNLALFKLLIQHGASGKDIDANDLMSLIGESSLPIAEKQEICTIMDISLKACLRRPTQSGLSPALASRATVTQSKKRKETSSEDAPPPLVSMTGEEPPEEPASVAKACSEPVAAYTNKDYGRSLFLAQMPVASAAATPPTSHHAAAAAELPALLLPPAVLTLPPEHSPEAASAKRAKTQHYPSASAAHPVAMSPAHIAMEQERVRRQVRLHELAEEQRQLQEQEQQHNLLMQRQIYSFQLHARYTGENLAAAQQDVDMQSQSVRELQARLAAAIQELEQKRNAFNQALDDYEFSHHRLENPQHYLERDRQNPAMLRDVTINDDDSTAGSLSRLYNRERQHQAQAAAANNRTTFFHRQSAVLASVVANPAAANNRAAFFHRQPAILASVVANPAAAIPFDSPNFG